MLRNNSNANNKFNINNRKNIFSIEYVLTVTFAQFEGLTAALFVIELLEFLVFFIYIIELTFNSGK